MFREVSTVEVKEVLRQRRQGRFLREIAQGVGLDRKTVRRYLEVAEAAGFDPTGNEVGDEVVSAVVRRLRPGLPSGVGRGERWFEPEDQLNCPGFDGGTALPWGGWRTFSDIFGNSVAELHTLSRKLIVIGETGSTMAGGDRSQWIRDMFAFARANPEISIINWFDIDKEADWSLDTSPSSLAAYTISVTNPTAHRLASRDAMHR